MKWPDDFINKIICRDCLEVMKEMPAKCIDMVITSPPYWGLRDYGFEQIFGGDKDCEHEWDRKIKKWHSDRGSGPRKEVFDDSFQIKGTRDDTCLKCQAWKGQLGLEPTSEMYIEHLTRIFNEVKRVLKKEGTLWLNIRDTYSSTRWSDTPSSTGISAKCSDVVLQKETDLPAKCLCMIPERLAWSLIQNGWILRNKIVWFKPNAMPSSVTDRFSNRWEYLFMFSKSQRYYFDLDAVREEPLTQEDRPYGIIRQREYGYQGKFSGQGQKAEQYGSPRARTERRNIGGRTDGFTSPPAGVAHIDGKNPGDVFKISTQPFPEAHFAVFPEKLCEKPIKAGCPEGGIILDPFAGAGTALFVAKQLRRRFIGIDIKREYVEMSNKRLAQGVL